MKSHELALVIYRDTKAFPREEVFGLTSRMGRSASSIPAYLAEGCGRTQPEFAHYLQVAFGSANELEYHLLSARDLGFLAATEYQRNIEGLQEIKKMLSTLLTKVRLSTMKLQSLNRVV